MPNARQAVRQYFNTGPGGRWYSQLLVSRGTNGEIGLSVTEGGILLNDRQRRNLIEFLGGTVPPDQEGELWKDV